jgi:hypothetical protein
MSSRRRHRVCFFILGKTKENNELKGGRRTTYLVCPDDCISHHTMQRTSAYEPYVHRDHGLLAYCPQSSQVIHLNHVCLYMTMQFVHPCSTRRKIDTRRAARLTMLTGRDADVQD